MVRRKKGLTTDLLRTYNGFMLDFVPTNIFPKKVHKVILISIAIASIHNNCGNRGIGGRYSINLYPHDIFLAFFEFLGISKVRAIKD